MDKYGKYSGRGALQVTCWGGDYCANYKNLEAGFGATDIEMNPDQISADHELIR